MPIDDTDEQNPMIHTTKDTNKGSVASQNHNNNPFAQLSPLPTAAAAPGGK